MRLELIATATFGLEAVVRREVEALGYDVSGTEDGRVCYAGDERAIVRSNLHLRCADRVLLKIDEFEVRDFESLFQRVKGFPWEEIIPMDGRFVVQCTSVRSALHNEPACQRTVKKAIALRLQDFYCQKRMPETGADYTVKLTLRKDRATITMDTSGEGLHKRGYRKKEVAAPMKETLAAALVQLSFWKPGRVLLDPACGSGTIAIEGAMLGMNIAPGLDRSFSSEDWEMIPQDLWKEERKRALEQIRLDENLRIYASDVDPRSVKAASLGAEEAGVEHAICIRQVSIEDWARSKEYEKMRKTEGLVIVTNLPYGKRIGEKETLASIYRTLAEIMKENPSWSLFVITADRDIEKALGRKADRRRKLYNGGMETTYYQYHGKKPERSGA